MNNDPNIKTSYSNKISSNNIANNNQIPTDNQAKEPDSFVKLAMRNMVKKGSTSIFHFSLTIFGVIGTLLGLAIIFH